jgi:hypothetical protein
MRKGEWAVFVLFVIVGLYFVLFHRAPLPLNHEAIGLGNMHFVHDIIGVVLIGIAGLIWWRSWRSTKAQTPT